jgi:hypothetical protein
LPVNYYLVTFTLPAALRCLARAYPKAVYALLMQCAAETLKTFGLNKKGLEAQLGLCAVLHTHNRRLDFHPHVHVVVPGGGIHPARREWRKLKGKYLFNGKALASVFRGIFLRALEEAGLTPGITPKRWIAHCKGVGRGEQALAYLARYLYRGVISNRHIIEDDDNYVTFRYRNSVTGKWETRRETGEVFIYLLMTAIMSPFVDAACITKGLSACQGLWLFARQRQGVIKNRTVGISCATTRTVKEDSQHLCMSLLWCRHGSQWHQTGTGEAGLSV